jgi:hypothetical protein
MHDPLEQLLAPHPPAPSRPELFARTVQALRGQRRRRQLAGIAILTAVYAAGLLTVLACQPPADPPPSVQAEVSSAASNPPVAPLARRAPDVEWQALDWPEEAAGLYREAGDLYLADADPAEAVRCYGNALNAGKPRDLEVSSDDSWLLMAIKTARKKERNTCDK